MDCWGWNWGLMVEINIICVVEVKIRGKRVFFNLVIVFSYLGIV